MLTKVIEIPVDMAEEDAFIRLPFDQQRSVIDWCITNRKKERTIDKVTYKIPNIIQIIYKCSKDGCYEVLRSRFFVDTIINGNVSKRIRCIKCGSAMYVSHKTAELSFIVSKRRKRRKELYGLLKFLEEEMDTQSQFDPEVDTDE